MDIKTELAKNMVRYVELKKVLSGLEEEMEELKRQNLEMVKALGLKKGEMAVFDEIGLAIQLIEMVRTEGVDEDGLIKKFGPEKIDYYYVISAKLVEAAIECGKLSENASCFIKKAEPVEYTKITKI